MNHLVILSHGIFGNPSTGDYFEEQFKNKHPNVIFYSLTSNYGKLFSFLSTTDGIKSGGDRIFEEIKNKIIDLQNNIKLKYISLIGISLGGIYLRYVIGKLFECKFFGLQPYTFATFASPHTGLKLYSGIAHKSLVNIFGRNTGKELLGKQGNIMQELADLRSIYYKGLKLFKYRILYGNYLYDAQVSYSCSTLLPVEFEYHNILKNKEQHTYNSQPHQFHDKFRIFLETTLHPDIATKYKHILADEYYTNFDELANTLNIEFTPCIELDIIKNLRTLSWTHVTVLFNEKLSSLLAHNNINAAAGYLTTGHDIVDYFIDNF